MTGERGRKIKFGDPVASTSAKVGAQGQKIKLNDPVASMSSKVGTQSQKMKLGNSFVKSSSLVDDRSSDAKSEMGFPPGKPGKSVDKSRAQLTKLANDPPLDVAVQSDKEVVNSTGLSVAQEMSGNEKDGDHSCTDNAVDNQMEVDEPEIQSSISSTGRMKTINTDSVTVVGPTPKLNINKNECPPDVEDRVLGDIKIRKPYKYMPHQQYIIRRKDKPWVKVTILSRTIARLRCGKFTKIVQMD